MKEYTTSQRLASAMADEEEKKKKKTEFVERQSLQHLVFIELGPHRKEEVTGLTLPQPTLCCLKCIISQRNIRGR